MSLFHDLCAFTQSGSALKKTLTILVNSNSSKNSRGPEFFLHTFLQYFAIRKKKKIKTKMHVKCGIASAATAAAFLLLGCLNSCDGASLRRTEVSQAMVLSSKEKELMYDDGICSPEKASKYKKVQFISFQISVREKTKIQDGEKKQGYHGIEIKDVAVKVDKDGKETNRVETYYADDEADYSKRLTLMKMAVDEAYAEAIKQGGNIDPSTDVLKIFSAPEFFFRGIKGTYDAKKAKDRIVPDLARFITNNKKFEDWLFLFGSIVGQLGPDHKNTYYNIGVIVRGNSKKTWIQPKAFLSEMDFLSAEDIVKDGGISYEEVQKVSPNTESGNTLNGDINAVKAAFEHDKDTKVVTSAFETDRITFAVEICLDHHYALARGYQYGMCSIVDTQVGCDPGETCKGNQDTGTCKRDDGQVSYNLRPPCKPRVQLIASAGMNIKKDSIAVQRGGYVFLTDGYHGPRGTANHNFHSDARKYKGEGNPLERYAVSNPLEAVNKRTSVDLFGQDWCKIVKDSFYTGEPDDECQAAARPKLDVYDAVPLPDIVPRDKK